ncbi:LysR family transcriptional regulator [Brucellaceae bacterium C25G]
MNTLRGIDLNLLVVLDALLDERHVSRAALRLNMSQPAVSHALSRLRHLFDDQLLIRRQGNLSLSTKAMEIAPILTQMLHQVHEILGSHNFNPSLEKRTFRLAMSDYGSGVVLPALMKILRRKAPFINLVITQASRETMLRMVVDGDCDLALGVFPELPEKIEAEELFVESFACLSDRSALGNLELLTLDAYLERPHVLVAMMDEANSEIDVALNAIGKTRRIAITLPHWGNAPRLIESTDLILTVAAKTLSFYENDPSVVLFPPPFLIPSFPFVQVWHERRSNDPSHLWLRELIKNVTDIL